ncbi:MAG: transposase [Roseivirga sp.]
MSTAYRFAESEIPHFITMTLVEWIDLFNREKYKLIIVDSLKFCIENKGLVIHSYVIMSNHVHLIITADPSESLSNIIRDFKRYTAKVLYETLKNDLEESRRNWMLWIIESQGERSSSNEHSKVWIHENHPVILDTDIMQDQRIQYIHENPVRAGICYAPEDYVYSSAGQYIGEKGPIPIEFL